MQMLSNVIKKNHWWANIKLKLSASENNILHFNILPAPSWQDLKALRAYKH